MVTDCVTVPSHISIDDAVRDYFLRLGYGGFPVEDAGRIRGLLSLSDVKRTPTEEWSRTSVQAIMVSVDERSSISADRDIVEALQRMAESGLGRLVVIDEVDQCVGFITHNGILRRLQLKEQLST
jgi:predicted transcriptional regulator